LQADADAGRGDRYCAALTKAGRAQVERNSIFATDGASCQDAIAREARILRKTNTNTISKPVKIVSVEVDGDSATIMVSDEGRAPSAVRLLKVDGKWKLPDPGYTLPPTAQ
jgi:hypothetical protein